jgi:peptidoglycan/xylan/chitin deacetylase (PgdA/CDA1 family)
MSATSWTYTQRLTRQYARALPSLHRVLRQLFPQALWMGHAAHNEIALTFDDGPHTKDTPALLNVLARHNVRATFFNTGSAFAHQRQLAGEMLGAGHQIALHGMQHQPFVHERLHPFVDGLRRLQAQMADATAFEPLHFVDVRPPYGVFTPHALTAMRHAGFRPVMWSSVPFHWHQTFDEAIVQVRRELVPGAIIVLHEGMTIGPSVVDLADAVVCVARDAGYRFVTVQEMWARQRGASAGDA